MRVKVICLFCCFFVIGCFGRHGDIPAGSDSQIEEVIRERAQEVSGMASPSFIVKSSPYYSGIIPFADDSEIKKMHIAEYTSTLILSGTTARAIHKIYCAFDAQTNGFLKAFSFWNANTFASEESEEREVKSIVYLKRYLDKHLKDISGLSISREFPGKLPKTTLYMALYIADIFGKYHDEVRHVQSASAFEAFFLKTDSIPLGMQSMLPSFTRDASTRYVWLVLTFGDDPDLRLENILQKETVFMNGAYYFIDDQTGIVLQSARLVITVPYSAVQEMPLSLPESPPDE